MLIESSVIAWDYLDRLGEIDDGLAVKRFLLTQVEMLFSQGVRSRLLLTNRDHRLSAIQARSSGGVTRAVHLSGPTSWELLASPGLYRFPGPVKPERSMQEIRIPPTTLDRVIARAAARHTTPAIQKLSRSVTWAGDKHLLVGLAAAYWLLSRHKDSERRVKGDHLLVTLAAASLVPTLLKSAVDQERPDRCMVGADRNGVRTSGNARDAFPSGHAVNMGAAASALGWIYPEKKAVFWSVAAAIAATRVAILAHWASYVVVGAALGAGLEAAIRRVALRRLARREAQTPDHRTSSAQKQA